MGPLTSAMVPVLWGGMLLLASIHRLLLKKNWDCFYPVIGIVNPVLGKCYQPYFPSTILRNRHCQLLFAIGQEYTPYRISIDSIGQTCENHHSWPVEHHKIGPTTGVLRRIVDMRSIHMIPLEQGSTKLR